MAFDVTTHNFETGKIGIAFDSTAVNGTELLLLKGDDASRQAFFIEYIQLSCGSGANLNLYDGSSGTAIISGFHSGCQQQNSQAWDFKDDALRTLVDTTDSLCVSGAADGIAQGFVKGYWGPQGG
jgi:hypothetical protein